MKNQAIMRDMTVGSPVRHVLLFAVPLFVGNIFQQVYNLTDTMVAGYNLGNQGIAAIGSTSTLYALLICLICGFNNGFGIVIARFFGAKDYKKMRQSIAAMIKINAILLAVLMSSFLLLLKPLMKVLNTPNDIWNAAYIYIAIIIWGLIAPILYNMAASFLRAVGNSRTPLYFLILACGGNVLLDFVFVMGFHTGVWGTALATVIAQLFSAILCIGFIRRNYREVLPTREDFASNPKISKEMFTTGFSVGLMMSVFSIGSVILQSAINDLGTTIITAHTSARRLVEMLMQPLSTIGVANSTFISQNWGAGKLDRIRNAMKKVYLMEFAWAVFAMIVGLFFGKVLMVLLTGTGDPSIIANGVMNIRINCFFFFPLGILLALRLAMQAMGSKVAPVVASVIELTMKVLSTYFIIPVFGYVGASFTEPSTWVACMAFLVVAYMLQRKKLFGARC